MRKYRNRLDIQAIVALSCGELHQTWKRVHGGNPSYPKPASLKDVARLAGVSHSTVSRALRNSRRVNTETIERIRRIAAESGYRASAVGRSLATRRTNTIGVVVTTITDAFAAEVVSGIEEAAAARGLLHLSGQLRRRSGSRDARRPHPR